MSVPIPLLNYVRLSFYAKSLCNKHGGKNFPPKHSDMYCLYKRLRKEYKRRPTPDLKYLATAIKLFARSRRFDNLSKVASLERRFGIRKLGFELDAAIATVGVGAMRRLIFDDVPLIKAPKTLSTSY